MRKEDGSSVAVRQLDTQEVLVRQTNTTCILQRILSNPSDHWSSWVTAAYIYGSTARGNARIDSDVDIALVSQIRFMSIEDAQQMGALLSDSFVEQLRTVGTKDLFIIHPNFLYKDWLDNPDGANITFPDVVKNVMKEGIKVFGRNTAVGALERT